MNTTAPVKATILIVEDEGLIAADLKEKLEDAGYTVPAIADNANAALVSVERFDLSGADGHPSEGFPGRN